jgi:hypothetical protein
MFVPVTRDEAYRSKGEARICECACNGHCADNQAKAPEVGWAEGARTDDVACKGKKELDKPSPEREQKVARGAAP